LRTGAEKYAKALKVKEQLKASDQEIDELLAKPKRTKKVKQ
jgi:hypothetical protein